MSVTFTAKPQSKSHTRGDLAVEPLITCRLCLLELPLVDMYKMKDCGCLYCQMCITQYLTVMIGEGTVLSITCPDGQCKKKGKFRPCEIETLIDTINLSRYKRLRFAREVDLDPHRTWCPGPGCETVCHVCSKLGHFDDLEVPIARPVKCPKCSLQFCSLCKHNWHEGQSCDTQDGLQVAGIPINDHEDAKIKSCPVCKIPIERTEGCAQMMCKQCKHVFCWYCLESLQDDFLLRHYDKGPCRNKLGHSRASVMWHRTQVVGIFAGLGLLLLVASPFLLLAAPCLMCCKCKFCKCVDIQEE